MLELRLKAWNQVLQHGARLQVEDEDSLLVTERTVVRCGVLEQRGGRWERG